MPLEASFDRWEPGEVVLLRQVIEGRVWAACPARAVEAGGGSVAVWIAPGTDTRRLRGIDGRVVRPPAEWETVAHRWFGNGNVDVIRAGEPFSIRLFWNEEGGFAGWYVNLQAPVTVSGGCIDTRDHALDIWLEPGQSPRWKDEDHLAQCVDRGIFSPAEADGIRATGEQFLQNRERYLPTGYESFKPSPAPMPALPTEWATP